MALHERFKPSQTSLKAKKKLSEDAQRKLSYEFYYKWRGRGE